MILEYMFEEDNRRLKAERAEEVMQTCNSCEFLDSTLQECVIDGRSRKSGDGVDCMYYTEVSKYAED